MYFHYLFNNYKAVIFDLDNTIYPEIEYLKRAYFQISKSIVLEENIDCENIMDIYYFLLNTFLTRGRKDLFQQTKNKYNLRKLTLNNFLDRLHQVSLVKNELNIFGDIKRLLQHLHKRKILLFILTNGNVTQQKNKIRSINIDINIFNEIIYASSNNGEFEKPNPYFINKIIDKYLIPRNEIILIGDSEIDRKTTINASIAFLQYPFD